MNKTIKVRVLKERVFLTETTPQAGVYCLQNQLGELGRREAPGWDVQLQSQATQTPPSPLPDGEGERRQLRKECAKELFILKIAIADHLKIDNQMMLLSGEHEFRVSYGGARLQTTT